MERIQILIVEDNPISAKLLSHFLKEYGDTEVAISQDEAVDLLTFCFEEKSPFDLVCVDLYIPGSGWEVIKKLHELKKQYQSDGFRPTKILLTTVTSEQEIISSQQDPSIHYDGYLQKPYTRENVRNALIKLGFITS